jgi:predicted component of type VI protein secretion system
MATKNSGESKKLDPKKLEDSPTKAVKGDSPTISVKADSLPESIFDQDWLDGKSTEELIIANLEIGEELKARMGQITERLAVADSPVTFKADLDMDALKYVPLPATAKEAPKDAANWRVVLISSDRKHKPLAFEIQDDVILGRKTPIGLQPDFDLTEYGADEHGVSRRHAVLRPRKQSLNLFDLGSTNGTKVNENNIKPHSITALTDGDTISLGKLHFKVKIVRRPKAAAKS